MDNIKESKEKGTSFLTSSFLKNQMNNKNEILVSNLLIKNTQSFNSFSKQLNAINQNITKLIRPSQQKKDFVKREDPNKKLYGAVDDLESLMRRSLELQKAQKPKGKGLLDLLGLAGLLGGIGLAGGGLISFILTGKSEHLHSLVKALTKYLPTRKLLAPLDDITKKFSSSVLKISKTVGSGAAKIAKSFAKKIMSDDAILGAKKVATSAKNVIPTVEEKSIQFGRKAVRSSKKIITEVTENIVTKNIDDAIKTTTSLTTKITGFWGNISKIFGPLSKLGQAPIVKGVGKLASQVGSKVGLKKIPIIGSLFSLYFAFDRFKKGDGIGGLLELASGATSLIPFAGIPLGLAIDSFLFIRDLKRPQSIDEAKGGAVGTIKKFGTDVLKSIPGIGTIIHFQDAMKLWNTDKIGSLKHIALIMGSIIPGANLVLDPILSFIESFVKNKGGIGGAAKNIMGNVAEAITHPIQFGKKLVSKTKDFFGEDSQYQSLKQNIKQKEGFRDVAYHDVKGYSIGYGHFLGADKKNIGKRITKEEADVLFEQDFNKVVQQAKQLPGFETQPYSAQEAIIDMMYNMGPGWTKENWPNLKKAIIEERDYDKAISIIRRSKYYTQVGQRAEENIQKLEVAKMSNVLPILTQNNNVQKITQTEAKQESLANLPDKPIQDKIVINTTNNEAIELSNNTIKLLAQAIGDKFKSAIPNGRSSNVKSGTSVFQ